MKTISIAKDFSRIPGARFPEEGNYSGSEFRQNVLLPALKEAIANREQLQVNLDGTAGLGTSFLEEVFGGLIRENDISFDVIKQTIVIISNEDSEYLDEINEYLEDAHEQKTNH